MLKLDVHFCGLFSNSIDFWSLGCQNRTIRDTYLRFDTIYRKNDLYLMDELRKVASESSDTLCILRFNSRYRIDTIRFADFSFFIFFLVNTVNLVATVGKEVK